MSKADVKDNLIKAKCIQSVIIISDDNNYKKGELYNCIRVVSGYKVESKKELLPHVFSEEKFKKYFEEC